MQTGMTVVSPPTQSQPEWSGTTFSSNERLELLPESSEPDRNIHRNEEEINTQKEVRRK